MARPVREVLAEISTWIDIADELAKRGIKGRPNCGKSCPMAVYILGEVSPIEVLSIHVDQWGTDVWGPEGGCEGFDNPQNMRNFIADFDDGVYRDLTTDPDLFFPEFDEENYWTDEEYEEADSAEYHPGEEFSGIGDGPW
jgi:hypothetical protein